MCSVGGIYVQISERKTIWFTPQAHVTRTRNWFTRIKEQFREGLRFSRNIHEHTLQQETNHVLLVNMKEKRYDKGYKSLDLTSKTLRAVLKLDKREKMMKKAGKWNYSIQLHQDSSDEVISSNPSEDMSED